MPLPFSFSAQRAAPVPEAPLGMGSAYTNPHELLGLVEQPGAVKDPAFSTPAIEAPVTGQRPAQLIDFQPSAPQNGTPLPLPNVPPRAPQAAPVLAMAPPLNAQPYLTLGQAPTTHFNVPPPPGATSTETERLLRELSGQVEQLRNDFFSAATTISALRDRVERLESRGGQGSGASAEVAALRTDFETWISQHLENAVEQCMRRVWARASMQSAPSPSNANV
jgi:hypothetical protein